MTPYTIDQFFTRDGIVKAYATYKDRRMEIDPNVALQEYAQMHESACKVLAAILANNLGAEYEVSAMYRTVRVCKKSSIELTIEASLLDTVDAVKEKLEDLHDRVYQRRAKMV